MLLGWHSFEHTQGRRPRSADLLLAPLLDRLVARKIRRRLGDRLRVFVSGGTPISPQIVRFSPVWVFRWSRGMASRRRAP
jgi:long-chain acyl-CoA synthetase